MTRHLPHFTAHCIALSLLLSISGISAMKMALNSTKARQKHAPALILMFFQLWLFAKVAACSAAATQLVSPVEQKEKLSRETNEELCLFSPSFLGDSERFSGELHSLSPRTSTAPAPACHSSAHDFFFLLTVLYSTPSFPLYVPEPTEVVLIVCFSCFFLF